MTLPSTLPMTSLDILQAYPLSDSQRRAALVRDCDVAVTAGAGTGQTRTLGARYLALLADGLPLRRIVAITFTRKAAREMRNRVRREIAAYLNQPQLSSAERQRWQDHFNRLMPHASAPFITCAARFFTLTRRRWALTPALTCWMKRKKLCWFRRRRRQHWPGQLPRGKSRHC